MTATNPYPLESIDASGSELRALIAAVFAATPYPQGTDDVTGAFGVVGNSLEVTGSGASVSVAQGIAVVGGTEAGDQHAYVVGNDAPVTIGSIPTAGTQRYDLVVVSVRDAEQSGANNDSPITRVAGTASTTPVDPSVPDNSLILARLRVSTGGVYQIDDLRPALTAQGGEVRCTSTTRPAWARNGQRIYETDTGEHLVYYSAPAEWLPEWSQPWGIISDEQSVANSGGWSNNTPVSLIQTPSFTLRQNRRYIVRGRVPFVNLSVAADVTHAGFLRITGLVDYQHYSIGSQGVSGNGPGFEFSTPPYTHTAADVSGFAEMLAALAWGSTAVTCIAADLLGYHYSIEVEDLGSVGPPV